MATSAMVAPAGVVGALHTKYGLYTIAANGNVVVDSRLVGDLLKANFTCATAPNMANKSRNQTVTLTAPGGQQSGIVQHDGVTYLISGGTVTVPRHAIEALVGAGFTGSGN